MLTSMSRIAHYGSHKELFNIASSLFSTSSKYVVSQGGQVYTGVVGKVTTKITVTIKNTFENENVLNKPLHEYFKQRILKIKEEFPDDDVRGEIIGDQYETAYYPYKAEEIVGLSSESSHDSGGMS